MCKRISFFPPISSLGLDALIRSKVFQWKAFTGCARNSILYCISYKNRGDILLQEKESNLYLVKKNFKIYIKIITFCSIHLNFYNLWFYFNRNYFDMLLYLSFEYCVNFCDIGVRSLNILTTILENSLKEILIFNS